MSEENDTSSATDQSVKDTGITAGELLSFQSAFLERYGYVRGTGYVEIELAPSLTGFDDVKMKWLEAPRESGSADD